LETPTATGTPGLSFDRTGEGDVDAKDLIIILGETFNPEYLFGFANAWWDEE
jgi:hypothetical protein